MDTTESVNFPPIEVMEPAASTAVAEQPAGGTPSLETLNLTKLALAYFGPWRADVASVNAKFSGLVLDLPNASKVADAKSLVHRHVGKPIATARATEDALKKKLNGAKGDVVAELTAIVAAYDDAAKPVRAQIEAAEAKIAEEKRKRDEAEAARVEVHKAGLAKLAGFVEFARGLPASRIADGITKVEAIVIDRAAWEEFADRAEEQKAVTLERMRKMHAEAVAEEARAAEAARVAAEQKAEAERLAAERAELDRQRREIAEAQALIEAKRKAEDAAAARQQQEAEARAAEQNTPVQASQQVLKAEAPAPDATDRDMPASTSPSVGSMGAGQPADAGPSGGLSLVPPPAAEVPMLKLGELWDLLGFGDREAFLAGLGFPATPAPKGTGKLYRAADVPAIRRAIAARMTAPEQQQAAA